MSKKRILHLVKTTHGAAWALQQASFLANNGYDVHVLLPDSTGPFYARWVSSSVTVHIGTLLSLPSLVEKIKPDLIHSHFFITTVAMRTLLVRRNIPRIFQIPGPLHLEYQFFRNADLLSADSRDYWIASSRAIETLLTRHGIPSSRCYLSYYGSNYDAFQAPTMPRPQRPFTWGNINYMYAPKKILFQKIGLKRHELLIQAAQQLQNRFDFEALFIGGQFGKDNSYEQSLRALAANIPSVKMPGKVTDAGVAEQWMKFDLAVHVPSSENCGGVVEPLLCQVPVLAAPTGGLPEVIINNITGRLLFDLDPHAIAEAIEEAKENYPLHKRYAQVGDNLVREMFNFKRTAQEVSEFYDHILEGKPYPQKYDSAARAKVFSHEA